MHDRLTTLNITPRAQQALHDFVRQNRQQLRLAINPGGCSGFDMMFTADQAKADDIKLGTIGAELLIDPVSLSVIAGATLDFVDEIGQEGFVVNNIPKMDARCGCGKSFSLSD